MRFLSIVVTCILAAILFGVLHDQITARVCVEYFTVGHAKAIDTDNPTLLGLYWGVVASWWAGLLLGLGLATAARVGPRPKRELKSFLKPIGGLLIVMALFAMIAGGVGYTMGIGGNIALHDTIRETVPNAKWPAFQACAFAHLASYYVAFIGGGMLIAWVWLSRKRLRPIRSNPPWLREGRPPIGESPKPS